MSGDDDYVYDDESGEWMPVGELRAKQAAATKAAEVVVRDSVGNVLADVAADLRRRTGLLGQALRLRAASTVSTHLLSGAASAEYWSCHLHQL